MRVLQQLLSALSIGCAAFVPVGAISHWVMVVPEKDYYIDQASIQRNGDTVRYSGKYLTLPNYAAEWLQQEAPQKPVSYLVDENQVDCDNKQVRYLRDTAYDARGGVVASHSFVSQWHDILPDTVAEVEWAFVCSRPQLPFPYNISGLH